MDASVAAPPGRPRVAVVLVAGVGDDGPGDTSDAVTRRLLRSSTEWQTADRHQVVVRDGDTTHTAHWARLNPTDGVPGVPVVDLYEMHWADLSRFPSGLLRFVFTLYALTIQIATVGLEALRPFKLHGPSRGRASAADRLLTAAAYALAFPVLMVTAATALMTAGLTLSVQMGGGRAATIVPVALTVIGVIALAVLGTGRLLRGGWHGSVRTVALIAALVASVLVVACAVKWHDGRVAIANALVFTVAYGFRPAWIALLTVAAAAAVALVVFQWRPRRRDPRHRAAHTALISLMVGPLVFAIASAVIVASFGAVARKTSNDRTWGDRSASVRCMTSANDWTVPEPCGRIDVGSDDTPASSRRVIEGQVRQIELLQGELRRLQAIPADPAGVGLTRRSALRGEIDRARDALKRTRDEAHLPDGAFAQFPVDWALRLFGFVLLPLVWATATALALMLLVVGSAGGYLASRVRAVGRWLAARIPAVARYLEAHPPAADRDTEVRLSAVGGRTFTWIPRALGGPVASVVAVVAILITLAAVVISWLADPAFIDRYLGGVPGWGKAAALLATGLLVGVRVLGVNPFANPAGTVRGGLERLRTVLDVAYDISNYLRASRHGQRGPRDRMIGRYRAVLGHVLAQQPDGLVVLCHSQGTILTTACLFGDEHRRGPVEPIGAGGVGTFPERVSLMTFGSPLRQIYDERFPLQFDRFADPDLQPDGIAPLTRHWWNIYRSGDYIGRALWAPEDDVATYDPDRGPTPRRVGGVTLADQCIGRGGHSGYWKSEEWSAFVRALIMDAAGSDHRIGEDGRPHPAPTPQ